MTHFEWFKSRYSDIRKEVREYLTTALTKNPEFCSYPQLDTKKTGRIVFTFDYWDGDTFKCGRGMIGSISFDPTDSYTSEYIYFQMVDENTEEHITTLELDDIDLGVVITQFFNWGL
jgi:hypothetical protein